MKRSGFKKKLTVPMKRTSFKRGKISFMKRTILRKFAKAHTAGWWQKQSDDLMQDIHKYMYNKCLVCGGNNEVGHHFITKALSSFLRYDFKNLIPLCHACHFRHHIKSDPYVSMVIVNHYGKDWFNWIESVRRNKIQTGVKYYQEQHAVFTVMLNKYKDQSNITL